MSQIIINVYCQNSSRSKCCCRKRCKKRCVKRRRKRRPKISVRPIVKRYFFIASQHMDLSEGTVIRAPQFVDDRGEPLHKFSNFGREGYFNLYINGVLQEGKMYQVNSSMLKLAATEQTILDKTPIILESVGFTARLIYK